MTTRRSLDEALVVGDGVVGLSIARELAGNGFTVTCVGSQDQSAAASPAAGAMLAAVSEVTESSSGFMDAEEQKLRVRSARMYPEFLAHLAEQTNMPIAHGAGTIVIANLANEDDRQNMRAISRTALKFGCPIEALDPEDIPGLDPARGYEPVDANFLPDEGWVDTRDLLTSLRKYLELEECVQFRPGIVKEVLHSDDAIKGVVLHDGEIVRSSVVVLAAGFGVSEIIENLGGIVRSIPKILPSKGVSLRVTDTQAEIPHVIRTPIRDFSCGTHVIPHPDETVYIGSTNRICSPRGRSTKVTLGELHAILDSAIHEVNVKFHLANMVGATHGIRAISSDSFPLIGNTEIPGLLIASGMYRNGVLLAPLVAKIVARTIVDTSDSDSDFFVPDYRYRSALSEDDRGADLEAGLARLVSLITGRAGSLPHNGHRELSAFLSRIGAEALLERNDPEVRHAKFLLSEYPVEEIVPYLYHGLIRGFPE